MVRAALRSLITSAGRLPGLRLSPRHTNAPEFGTMLPLPVAAVSVAQSLAKTVTLRCDLELEAPVCPRRSSQRHEHYTKELRCSAAGRKVGGRPGDVMSDLGAACTAVRPAQCRESRASRAQDAPKKLCFGGQVAKRRRSRPQGPARGVDAFDGTTVPPAARLCQSKRKTLPGEGRRKGNPLSTSIIHSTSSFGKLNKI